jgi:hypothetical protein
MLVGGVIGQHWPNGLRPVRTVVGEKILCCTVQVDGLHAGWPGALQMQPAPST